jgi:hypothetical protein
MTPRAQKSSRRISQPQTADPPSITPQQPGQLALDHALGSAGGVADHIGGWPDRSGKQLRQE